MTLIRTNTEVDVFEYVEGAAGVPYDTAASTADPFDPTVMWWRRWRAVVPADVQPITGRLRDLLFGERQGSFVAIYFERGLLVPVGRPDTDFLRRWSVRDPAAGTWWVVDFNPNVYDAPLAHIQCYAKELDPEPVNHD